MFASVSLGRVLRLGGKRRRKAVALQLLRGGLGDNSAGTGPRINVDGAFVRDSIKRRNAALRALRIVKQSACLRLSALQQ